MYENYVLGEIHIKGNDAMKKRKFLMPQKTSADNISPDCRCIGAKSWERGGGQSRLETDTPWLNATSFHRFHLRLTIAPSLPCLFLTLYEVFSASLPPLCSPSLWWLICICIWKTKTKLDFGIPGKDNKDTGPRCGWLLNGSKLKCWLCWAQKHHQL